MKPSTKLTSEQAALAQQCLEEENKGPHGSMKYLVDTFGDDPVQWNGVLANALCRAGKLPCDKCGKPTSMYGGPQCFNCYKPGYNDIKVLNLGLAMNYIREREPEFNFYEMFCERYEPNNDSAIPFRFYPEDMDDNDSDREFEKQCNLFAKYYPEILTENVLLLLSW